MSKLMTAIGLMSGDALEGVDAAILTTDGERTVQHGPALHAPYSRDVKIWLRRAVKAALEGRDGAADIGKAAGELTLAHVDAVERLLIEAGVKRTDVDVIGFHGQTILHRPARGPEALGRSWQIGDGAVLAQETKIDVVNDFRAADIKAGGEGAPLTPLYHQALIAAMDDRYEGAFGVINLGEMARVTYVPASGEGNLVSFDCGPGYGLLNEWMVLRTGSDMDENGLCARSGQVHADRLRMMLLHPYLRRQPPKSLDRNDFRLDGLLDLPTNDGAATLTAFIAACLRRAEDLLPAPPTDWVVSGGGARNDAMMEAIRKALGGRVMYAEDVGWRSDSLEAECFAYLAVRALKKFPLSYPSTTRAAAPTLGGVYHRAPI